MTIIGATRMIKYLRAEKAANKKPKIKSAYSRRNARLSELGYAGYQEYLASEEWAAIRRAKLKRFPQCLTCDHPASQVHHLSYDERTLLGLEPKQLVTLCDGCHRKIEFDEAGEKRRLCDANKALRAMAHEAGKQRWLGTFRRDRKKAKKGRKKS